MREDLVYLRTKEWLAGRGWKVVAGQPPSGTDHLPVVEVKLPVRDRKGSAGAFKPDLVAFKANLGLLVECKPRFSVRDMLKLEEILGSRPRLAALEAELVLRGLLNPSIQFIGTWLGALSHAELMSPARDRVGQFIFDESAAAEVVPASSWSPRTLELFL